ncbi:MULTISPECIES: hypothetical protein [unclassified Paenibacillus]|uniref:hypothetical protein n=1 Tax=unclassified Paenibacillus TaxID=185978 RepID=UPI00020D73F9|nr:MULTISPECIES: hypothetical protein [unclassified Paenibacillus]EGL17472.1 hypothetical protein HMPREF9413_5395 [Paenibacillus sp. HGF7]EPD81276.1 hypothetical protein HMPREF1207_05033 [Paenibacillus sp. HGH0039]
MKIRDIDQPETFRKTGEDLDDYLVRLGDNFDLYGLTWTTASSLLNSEADEEYSESKWRKDYNSYLRWKDKLTLKLSNDGEYLQEIQDKTTELLKEKIRLQDQKRKYTTTVRYQARFEHLKNEIHKSILALSRIKPLNFQLPTPVSSHVRANILWLDWHYGSDFKNSLNEYSPDIFRTRLQKLVSQTIEYIKLHKVNTLTVGALGDFLAGPIHVSNRVQSSETIIEQIQVVSETLAESIVELSKHVQQICFINIIGNHARLIPNKTESILNENLENLILWYMQSRLKDFKNVEIHQDTDGYYVDTSFSPCHVYVQDSTGVTIAGPKVTITGGLPDDQLNPDFKSRKFKGMGDLGKLLEDQFSSMLAYVAEQERKKNKKLQAEGIEVAMTRLLLHMILGKLDRLLHGRQWIKQA